MAHRPGTPTRPLADPVPCSVAPAPCRPHGGLAQRAQGSWGLNSVSLPRPARVSPCRDGSEETLPACGPWSPLEARPAGRRGAESVWSAWRGGCFTRPARPSPGGLSRTRQRLPASVCARSPPAKPQTQRAPQAQWLLLLGRDAEGRVWPARPSPATPARRGCCGPPPPPRLLPPPPPPRPDRRLCLQRLTSGNGR